MLNSSLPLSIPPLLSPPLQASDPSFYLEMYEQVSYHGWFGVLLVAQYQPVIVSLDASTSGFKTFSGVRE